MALHHSSVRGQYSDKYEITFINSTARVDEYIVVINIEWVLSVRPNHESAPTPLYGAFANSCSMQNDIYFNNL